MKESEREIGGGIEEVAKKSCLDLTELEQNLCSLNSSAANKKGVADLKASCDIGWQRKGVGREHNNRSRHGVLIGTENEKILSYGRRISNCKQYEVNKVTGRVKKHDCRMHWGVSSKAMESDLAVDMFVSSTTEKVRISINIIDEDSTAMAKIKESVPHEVTKEGDINNAKKTVGNDLYALQKKHHILSSKVICYLQKCFSYRIKQNKNDPVLTKASIQNIVPHCFRDHKKCNEKWCIGKLDASYKHKSLPYGRDLCGEELKKDLNSVFEKDAKNADALTQIEVLVIMNLSTKLLHQRHPKCIITQNQKASTFALLQRFAKRALFRLTRLM